MAAAPHSHSGDGGDLQGMPGTGLGEGTRYLRVRAADDPLAVHLQDLCFFIRLGMSNLDGLERLSEIEENPLIIMTGAGLSKHLVIRFAEIEPQYDDGKEFFGYFEFDIRNFLEAGGTHELARQVLNDFASELAQYFSIWVQRHTQPWNQVKLTKTPGKGLTHYSKFVVQGFGKADCHEAGEQPGTQLRTITMYDHAAFYEDWEYVIRFRCTDPITEDPGADSNAGNDSDMDTGASMAPRDHCLRDFSCTA